MLFSHKWGNLVVRDVGGNTVWATKNKYYKDGNLPDSSTRFVAELGDDCNFVIYAEFPTTRVAVWTWNHGDGDVPSLADDNVCVHNCGNT